MTASVAVHPLVLLNISDHLTRFCNDDGRFNNNQPLIGALLGVQNGREVEIITSYPLLLDLADGNGVKFSLDFKFFDSEQEQIKQVFPTYEFIGWYSVGKLPAAQDIFLHKQILERYNTNSLLLMFDPSTLKVAEMREKLPIEIYETMPGVASAADLMKQSIPCGGNFHLVGIDYLLETSDAELIGVEHAVHINRHIEVGKSGSQQNNAISILASRIRQVHAYMADIGENRRSADPTIMREINSLCGKLNFMMANESEELARLLEKESQDTEAINSLNQATQLLSQLSNVIDKSNIAYYAIAKT